MLGKANIRNGDRNIPPGALISFLQKGLQYVGIEEQLYREDQKAKGNAKTDTGAADEVDFSLLSHPAIEALTRPDPPIQLHLPPAAAAAAVKARLETEDKLRREKEERERQRQLSDQAASSTSLPPEHQYALEQSAMAGSIDARNALVAQAAAAQAVAAQAAVAQVAAAAAASPYNQAGMNAMGLAMQQKQQFHDHANNIQAQKPRAKAEAKGMQALSNAVKKPAKKAKGEKRSKKSKVSKKTEQEHHNAEPLPASNPLHLIAQASAQPGLSSLEQAVARLEASQKEDQDRPQPMDIEGGNDQSETAKPAQQQLNGQHDSQSNGSNGAKGGETPSDDGAASGELSTADKKVDEEDALTNAQQSEIVELTMHSSEVFMCAWNPIFTSFIATGSGDASARIWQMGGENAGAGLGPVRLLPHGEDPRDKNNKDVTTLEWSSDGKLLATGSYDGVARVWTKGGALLHTLRGHKGPIFSLKWNKRGNYLLSGSYDKTTIVWDVSGNTGSIQQQFTDHQAPALDVDWKDDTTFASCSTDKTVNICKVGVTLPLKTFCGHTDEVNAVKWDPSGTLLASCSDDCTAKVWDFTSDSTFPAQDFKSHRQEIYTVKW